MSCPWVEDVVRWTVLWSMLSVNGTCRCCPMRYAWVVDFVRWKFLQDVVRLVVLRLISIFCCLIWLSVIVDIIRWGLIWSEVLSVDWCCCLLSCPWLWLLSDVLFHTDWYSVVQWLVFWLWALSRDEISWPERDRMVEIKLSIQSLSWVCLLSRLSVCHDDRQLSIAWPYHIRQSYLFTGLFLWELANNNYKHFPLVD